MPMYKPAMLNSVEHIPMITDAIRTAFSATSCRQAKEMPTAKASMLVAIDKVKIFKWLSILIFLLSFFLHPSHIIFMPR